jgi:hypothetical protein
MHLRMQEYRQGELEVSRKHRADADMVTALDRIRAHVPELPANAVQ